jgi:hypothetical protein
MAARAPPECRLSRNAHARNHALSALETACIEDLNMTDSPRILFCNCTYAQVVPREVKEAVLRKLSDSGVAFDAVADLCELSARQDPALPRLAAGGPVKIAACFPRAVKWLFAAGKAPLPSDGAEILNMRVQTAEEIIASLLSSDLKPNLPTGKVTASDAPAALAASPPAA